MLVKNNSARLINLGGKYTLLPGITEQPDELKSDKSIQTPATKALFEPQDGEKPVLEFVSGGKATASASASSGSSSGAPDASGASLSDFNAKEAVSLVGETVDQSLLERWESEEQAGQRRKTVLDAIDAQLDKLQLTDAEKAGK